MEILTPSHTDGKINLPKKYIYVIITTVILPINGGFGKVEMENIIEMMSALLQKGGHRIIVFNVLEFGGDSGCSSTPGESCIQIHIDPAIADRFGA